MCDHEPTLLGTMQLAGANRDLLEADLIRIRGELLELTRAKTGLECELTACDHGFAVTVGTTPSFGRIPPWCSRAIDRANPADLIMRVEPITQRADGAFEARVLLFAKQGG